MFQAFSYAQYFMNDELSFIAEPRHNHIIFYNHQPLNTLASTTTTTIQRSSSITVKCSLSHDSLIFSQTANRKKQIIIVLSYFRIILSELLIQKGN